MIVIKNIVQKIEMSIHKLKKFILRNSLVINYYTKQLDIEYYY